MLTIALLITGIAVGAISGLVGIAGGIILIPTLVLGFHYNEKMAQGTSLAVLIPPITLAAAFVYYRQGNVNIKAAAILATGFFIGGFIGAIETGHLSSLVLQRGMGVIMLAAALKLIFF